MSSGAGSTSIPRPASGEVGLYLTGPGFGESGVVLTNDSGMETCVVVDSCQTNGEHLTVSLLKALAVPSVNLLVITHPDLDHVRGLPELLKEFPPRRLWRYPTGTLRDLASGWCRERSGDKRLAELHAALIAIDALHEQGVASDVCLDTRCFTPSANVEVSCLAPTQYDQLQERALLRAIVSNTGTTDLGAALREYLLGDRRALGDHPNTLSLALSVRLGSNRILIAGDVENGSPPPRSGWKGIVTELREDGRVDEISALAAVKVAHHGSAGAFDVATWRLHARPDGRTVAITSPFNGQSLPAKTTMVQLREHARTLGITSDAGGAFARAREAGWLDCTVDEAHPTAAFVGIIVGNAPPRLFAGSEGRFFESPA